MVEEEIDLTLFKSLDRNEAAIRILELLNRISEPLRMVDIVEITGLSWSIVDSVTFRLERAGILIACRNQFEPRAKFLKIADKKVLSGFLEWHREQESKKPRREYRSSGSAEEV